PHSSNSSCPPLAGRRSTVAIAETGCRFDGGQATATLTSTGPGAAATGRASLADVLPVAWIGEEAGPAPVLPLGDPDHPVRVALHLEAIARILIRSIGQRHVTRFGRDRLVGVAGRLLEDQNIEVPVCPVRH